MGRNYADGLNLDLDVQSHQRKIQGSSFLKISSVLLAYQSRKHRELRRIRNKLHTLNRLIPGTYNIVIESGKKSTKTVNRNLIVEYEGFDNDEGNEHQHDLVLHLPERKRAVNGDRRRRYLGGDGGVIDVTACLLPCHSAEEEELTNGPNPNGREWPYLSAI